MNNGGETGIRTQERVAPLPVFKTGAFNRSAISPCASVYRILKPFQLKNDIYGTQFKLIYETISI
tara:strand:- start:215 stop:409 length:195 start_codon:yes stop_codon:yes gene_type:complete